MYSAATTVDEYLDELSEDRRASMETVRKVILDNIPEGYEETMQFGMIGYVIPLERYPVTYNGQALQRGCALLPEELHVSVPDERLRRPETPGVVRGGVPGERQEAQHGEGLYTLQETGRPANGFDCQGHFPYVPGPVHRVVRGGPGQDKQAGQALQVETRLTLGSFVNPLPN